MDAGRPLDVDPAVNAGPPTVLLVEDNAEMRAFLRKQLSDQYRVSEARDGEEAWEQVQEAPPDLLISDIQLSGTSGPDLCRRIKETGGVPPIPVILLAGEEARVEDSPAENPFVPEADEVLTKPFAVAELRKRMERYLPSRELPGLSGKDDPGEFLKTVVRAIERRLHDPTFTVGDLAEAVALSRRHLTRRLKSVAGATPAALIRSQRIERAKSQIEKGPETIAEVGRAVGFRSASHFSHVFRKEVGCSPSTYRDRHAS